MRVLNHWRFIRVAVAKYAPLFLFLIALYTSVLRAAHFPHDALEGAYTEVRPAI